MQRKWTKGPQEKRPQADDTDDIPLISHTSWLFKKERREEERAVSVRNRKKTVRTVSIVSDAVLGWRELNSRADRTPTDSIRGIYVPNIVNT